MKKRGVQKKVKAKPIVHRATRVQMVNRDSGRLVPVRVKTPPDLGSMTGDKTCVVSVGALAADAIDTSAPPKKTGECWSIYSGGHYIKMYDAGGTSISWHGEVRQTQARVNNFRTGRSIERLERVIRSLPPGAQSRFTGGEGQEVINSIVLALAEQTVPEEFIMPLLRLARVGPRRVHAGRHADQFGLPSSWWKMLAALKDAKWPLLVPWILTQTGWNFNGLGGYQVCMGRGHPRNIRLIDDQAEYGRTRACCFEGMHAPVRIAPIPQALEDIYMQLSEKLLGMEAPPEAGLRLGTAIEVARGFPWVTIDHPDPLKPNSPSIVKLWRRNEGGVIVELTGDFKMWVFPRDFTPTPLAPNCPFCSRTLIPLRYINSQPAIPAGDRRKFYCCKHGNPRGPLNAYVSRTDGTSLSGVIRVALSPSGVKIISKGSAGAAYHKWGDCLMVTPKTNASCPQGSLFMPCVGKPLVVECGCPPPCGNKRYVIGTNRLGDIYTEHEIDETQNIRCGCERECCGVASARSYKLRNGETWIIPCLKILGSMDYWGFPMLNGERPYWEVVYLSTWRSYAPNLRRWGPWAERLLNNPRNLPHPAWAMAAHLQATIGPDVNLRAHPEYMNLIHGYGPHIYGWGEHAHANPIDPFPPLEDIDVPPEEDLDEDLDDELDEDVEEDMEEDAITPPIPPVVPNPMPTAVEIGAVTGHPFFTGDLPRGPLLRGTDWATGGTAT